MGPGFESLKVHHVHSHIARIALQPCTTSLRDVGRIAEQFFHHVHKHTTCNKHVGRIASQFFYQKSVILTQRVHPFPFRTRKLSSAVAKILVWRRTGKIAHCRHTTSLCDVGRIASNSSAKVGVFNAEGPPVPIPNTEVKLCSGENTCLETDREDSSMPTQKRDIWKPRISLKNFTRKSVFIFLLSSSRPPTEPSRNIHFIHIPP